ncbi:peroxidase 5-like protein [Carex littledalei]|uniref:Peroxidase n=1 Tax=Carex littledalei TaxID=544730 RepID=A0A833V4Q3_9POAL|nr:peroxidase 5-like protein [Carex littledalei]
MTMNYYCLIFAILLSFPCAYGDLKPKFYEAKCPRVEDAIANAVATAEKNNPGICAGVIRLHFHDCFVNGCDGSVLLDNPNSEKTSDDNIGLRGFNVIEAAKIAAEKSCGKPSPPLVSCADVLAYAARDCVNILGGFTYEVVAGRFDSKVSRKEDTTGNLPAANFTFEELKDNFAKKKLSAVDLVALTGAHSIGVAHCLSFKERFTNVKTSEIDPTYADSLREKCKNGDFVIVSQDHVTSNRLDVQWYKNENQNKVLFLSDWVLRTDSASQSLMNNFAGLNRNLPPQFIKWEPAFIDAMQKMGKIPGGPGEIRKVCNAVN